MKNAKIMVEQRSISSALVQGWTEKQFQAAATARSVNDLTPEARSLLEGGKITANFRDQMLEFLRQKKQGILLSYGSMLATAWSKKEEVDISPVSISLGSESGLIHVTTPPSPLPYLPELKERTGIQHMSALLSGLYGMDDKKIVRKLSEAGLAEMFKGTKSGITSILALQSSFEEIAQPFLDSKSDIEKLSLTGEKWVQFVIQVLSSCSLADYYAVHSSVVLKVLKLIKKSKLGGYIKTDLSDNSLVLWTDRVVPEETRSDVAINEVLDTLGYCAVWKRELPDYWKPNIFPKQKKEGEVAQQTFTAAYNAYIVYNSILGGERSGLSTLSAGYGLLSMTSSSERFVIRATSLVLGMLIKGFKVALRIPTIGHLGMIEDSYRVWAGPKFSDTGDLQFILTAEEMSKTRGKSFTKRTVVAPAAEYAVVYFSDRKFTITSSKVSDVFAEGDAEFATLATQYEGRKILYYGPLWGNLLTAQKNVFNLPVGIVRWICWNLCEY